jgi:hypothetical protein
LCGGLIPLGCFGRQPFSLLDKKKKEERERERNFLLSNSCAKKAGVTASLQIIKVNLCGVFVLFIEHKLLDQFSPWLAPELCKSGRQAGRPTDPEL